MQLSKGTVILLRTGIIYELLLSTLFLDLQVVYSDFTCRKIGSLLKPVETYSHFLLLKSLKGKASFGKTQLERMRVEKEDKHRMEGKVGQCQNSPHVFG